MPKYLVKGSMLIRGKRVEGTSQRPAEVELPSDVFYLTAPRYLDGEYVKASPDEPAELHLPEGSVIDSGLRPGEPPAAPKPHFVPDRVSTAPTAAEQFSKAKGGKRPSDDAL